MEQLLSSHEIVRSWNGLFNFKRDNPPQKGLRSPQIGALHAILAHIEDGNEKGIIVMPIGTSKTETMLSFLIANQCEKVFVVVPSDALRNQTYKKFKYLGLLPSLGRAAIIDSFPLGKLLVIKPGISYHLVSCF